MICRDRKADRKAASAPRRLVGRVAKKPLPEAARLVGSIHDEVIVEAREEEADAMAAVLSGSMHAADRTYLQRVTLPEMAVTKGKTWAAKG